MEDARLATQWDAWPATEPMPLCVHWPSLVRVTLHSPIFRATRRKFVQSEASVAVRCRTERSNKIAMNVSDRNRNQQTDGDHIARTKAGIHLNAGDRCTRVVVSIAVSC